MIETVNVKGITIGAGRPKLIVPIAESMQSKVLEKARELASRKDVDVVELRLDPLDSVADTLSIARLTSQVYDIIATKVLLVTFRTKPEGGKKAIEDADYCALYQQILTYGKTDLLDIEMFRNQVLVHKLVAHAHDIGVGVVMSSHDFEKTPPQEEMVRRLRLQQEMGADVLKIAAMPKDAGDVLTLMNATWEMHSKYAKKPLLTMSMGGTGVVSRLTGELTGSAMAFGMVGESSAPGQVEAHNLHQVLDIIHQASAS